MVYRVAYYVSGDVSVHVRNLVGTAHPTWASASLFGNLGRADCLSRMEVAWIHWFTSFSAGKQALPFGKHKEACGTLSFRMNRPDLVLRKWQARSEPGGGSKFYTVVQYNKF